jgi:hypothetical protein
LGDGGVEHDRKRDDGRNHEGEAAAIFMPRLPDVTALTHSTYMIVHRRCAALVHGLLKAVAGRAAWLGHARTAVGV